MHFQRWPWAPSALSGTMQCLKACYSRASNNSNTPSLVWLSVRREQSLLHPMVCWAFWWEQMIPYEKASQHQLSPGWLWHCIVLSSLLPPVGTSTTSTSRQEQSTNTSRLSSTFALAPSTSTVQSTKLARREVPEWSKSCYGLVVDAVGRTSIVFVCPVCHSTAPCDHVYRGDDDNGRHGDSVWRTFLELTPKQEHCRCFAKAHPYSLLSILWMTTTRCLMSQQACARRKSRRPPPSPSAHSTCLTLWQIPFTL